DNPVDRAADGVECGVDDANDCCGHAIPKIHSL
ncbi:MAG: hypothetical protein ACJA2F_001139, partial [Nitriliruptoraceae bacterium]